MTTFADQLDFQQYTVLVVDDNPTNLAVLSDFLTSVGFRLLIARNGASAVSRAARGQPDIILLDVMMPEMDGFEACRQLKANPDTQDIPILFMTALAETVDKVAGFAAGAVDYITKPAQHEEVLARMTTHLKIRNLTQRLARRAMQLQTGGVVGRQITSILDINALLAEVVKLVQEQFDYYFVSVWLINEEQGAAILRMGSGQNEAEMLARSLAIPLNQERSIIAKVARSGHLHLSNQVEKDESYMQIEGLLPDTAAELALPLRMGDNVLGVLDIQSAEINAFDDDDTAVLQMVADQLAIAIRNARLYSQTKRFNEELEQTVARRTEDLQTAYAQLAEMDRAKSNFITVASHELRTPLTIVKGYSQILREAEELVQNADLLRIVQGIYQGALRLHEIVNSMLDVAKIDSRALELYSEPLAVLVALQRVEAELQDALLERNLTLILEGNLRSLPLIEADPDALLKVFYHLTVNAVKYTPDGGQITISGRPWHSSDGPPPEEGIEVIVRDNGIGISADALELIFAKFYQTGDARLHSTGRTKFKGGGPGLGLTIVQGIVAAHGGRVWAESPGYDEEKCPGSSFHVALPLRQGIVS